jgi:tRNA pseudouridine38-40 synthase
MHRSPTWALWIWYRGTRFRGFQRQVEGPTVQEALERALATVGPRRTVHPAGRTDRGVHARMQVASIRAEHFDPDALRTALPEHVGLALAKRAGKSFHAQWSASGKEYRYRLAAPPAPPGWAGSCWEPPWPVDLARFSALLRAAEGTRDFSAFHEKSSPIKPRTLSSAEVVELSSGVAEVRLRGNGFARYQVRYLVGSAAAAASGALPAEDFLAAVESAKSIAGFKAPGEGLTLWEVLYPADLDPFSAEERAAATGLPQEPPWISR